MANKKVFIAIAGNIGTGKSTLTQMLSERLNWTPHYEAVQDNPFLRDFYLDMKRWAFSLQIYFLNHRFQAHQTVSQSLDNGIQDRSIYEDAHIFARNLFDQGIMELRDYENYLNLYHKMCEFLPPPDLVIYLRKSLPVLKARIASRGRDFEASIPDDYLAHLNHYYDDWMQNYTLGKKLIIESDSLDFIGKPEHFNTLIQKISGALEQPLLNQGMRVDLSHSPQISSLELKL